MRQYILAAILQLIAILSFSQAPVVPAEARPFILEGLEVLDYKIGDLNGDKKQDAILILKMAGEDSITDETPARPLLVLIRQGNGKLSEVIKNDQIVMCRQCGGVFGDPYEGMEMKNNAFSISFYGGSSWRWGYTYDFAYRPLKKTWVLTKETQFSFQSGDPEKTMKTVIIGEPELGLVTLDKFDSEHGYEDSKWKVTAAKTYFFDSPKLGSKPRKAFLLKGNSVSAVRQLKNFIEVNFENSKGEISSGFILRKDLAAAR